jgi:hypothetical protein
MAVEILADETEEVVVKRSVLGRAVGVLKLRAEQDKLRVEISWNSNVYGVARA